MATTRNPQRAHVGFSEGGVSSTEAYPPAFLEYIWYATIVYAMLGQAWGIVIPSVGGAVLVVIAVSCFLTVGSQSLRVYKPVAWALCTGIFMIAIQFIFHEGNEAALKEATYIFNWLALLITVQTLSLRPGFLHRFALVAFVIGLASLTNVSFRSVGGGVTRAWATGTGLSNPNVLGMWFGFCAVYFLFWGLQCRKTMLSVWSWTAAVVCLYVVTISVSRAPLLAIALASIVGFRSVLKRSFVPLFSLVLVMCLIYVSGIFDDELGYYTTRGAEETGRSKLFQIALERILDSPWIGVGLGDIRVRYGPNRFVNPHNGLLHIALAGGIIPLFCFLGYLGRAFIGFLRLNQMVQMAETAVLVPLVVFALFEIMVLDYVFMSPWTVVILGLAAGTSRANGHQRLMNAYANPL